MNSRHDLQTFILHMPHTGTEIPDWTGYVVSDEAIQCEMERVTDWGIAEIFRFDGTTSIKPSFSRLFCDVERFTDDKEPLSDSGFGITYVRRESGEVMRELTEHEREQIVETYYKPHHDTFSHMVSRKIESHGTAFIIDCHSFPNKPLAWEDHPELHRPDICIGTDAFHTPKKVAEYAVDRFSSHGYDVALNHPFAGTIIPSEFYRNKKVFSIMIEINRRLFRNEENRELDFEKIAILNKQIRSFLSTLSANILNK